MRSSDGNQRNVSLSRLSRFEIGGESFRKDCTENFNPLCREAPKRPHNQMNLLLWLEEPHLQAFQGLDVFTYSAIKQRNNA